MIDTGQHGGKAYLHIQQYSFICIGHAYAIEYYIFCNHLIYVVNLCYRFVHELHLISVTKACKENAYPHTLSKPPSHLSFSYPFGNL